MNQSPSTQPTTPVLPAAISINERSPSSSTNVPASALPPEPIPAVPPPWKLRGDVYFFSFWTSASQARNLPSMAYSPLESRSEYASSSFSRPVGGVSMVQILRYRESPVGPYDELLVVPGSFDWIRDEANGKQKRGRNPKISRIYVSQKHTCYNGRLNWNVPKHLARFDWTEEPNGAISVKVYPHDGDASFSSLAVPIETHPSSEPFFQASFKPMRYVPSFPFATRWARFFGIDTTLVLPPLPEGKGSQGELPGTDQWRTVIPVQFSRQTKLGWFDLSQRDQKGDVVGDYENFWPGLGRWQVGMKMENADLEFGYPEIWDRPRSHL